MDLMARHTAPLQPIPTDCASNVPRLEGISAVVFDVYGTMLISGCGEIGSATAVDSAEAAQLALTELDLHPKSNAGAACVRWLKEAIHSDHTVKCSQGIDYPEVDICLIWQTVLVRALNEGLIKGMADPRAVSVAYECRVNPVWPMPGLREVIAAMRSFGLELGMVSNAQFFTSLLVEMLLGQSLANLGFASKRCIWSYRLGEAKPALRLYQLLLDNMGGIKPEQILYVGNDVRNDILPASKIGMRTALFAGDRRSLRLREDDPNCASVCPDAIVTDLHQLLNIVGIEL